MVVSSSNVNEVIRAVLNFILFIKRFHTHTHTHAHTHTHTHTKHKNVHKRSKIKKAAFYAHKKHLRGKKSPIRLFAFLCFCLVASWCFWCFWYFWCVQSLFVKKKEFKTTLKPNLHYYCFIPEKGIIFSKSVRGTSKKLKNTVFQICYLLLPNIPEKWHVWYVIFSKWW